MLVLFVPLDDTVDVFIFVESSLRLSDDVVPADDDCISSDEAGFLSKAMPVLNLSSKLSKPPNWPNLWKNFKK